MNEYTLIDCKTELIYGPYDSCLYAMMQAYHLDLEEWEITDQNGKLVDWGKRNEENNCYA